MPANEKANRGSWKAQPCPTDREVFDLPLLFTQAEGERLILGHVPTEMEDKWFLFFEDGWLYFHRSWTGACIFGVKLDLSPNSVRVVECWASRDQSEYNSPGVEAERKLIVQLISSKLLH